MRTDKPFIEAMRHATQLVRTQGAVAATRYIQGLFRARPEAPPAAPVDARAENSGDNVVEVLDPVSAPAAPADTKPVVDIVADVRDPLPASAPKADARPEPVIDTVEVLEPRPAHAPPADTVLPPLPRDLPHDSGRFLAMRFSNQSGARNYKLYVPASYAGTPAPLVVMLHGCTQDPDDFALGTRANRWAESKRCLVVYPEQLRRENSLRCWNWFRPGDQQSGRGEPAIIAGIVRQVIDEYQVDARRVYVAGLSAGGAMAAILGQEYPELFAAIGIHSGVPVGIARDVPSAFAVMKNGPSGQRATPDTTHRRAVPTIVVHGDADQTVHPANAGRVVADAIEAHSIAQPQRSLHTVVEFAEKTTDAHAYRRTTHADASGAILIEQWELHSAGHAWSGGHARGSHTDARGPDATRSMLEFFDQHVRADAAAPAKDSAAPT